MEEEEDLRSFDLSFIYLNRECVDFLHMYKKYCFMTPKKYLILKERSGLSWMSTFQ